jgi:hypothetical protein
MNPVIWITKSGVISRERVTNRQTEPKDIEKALKRRAWKG